MDIKPILDAALKVLREGAELAAKLPALGLSAPW